ncbi:MAG: hypothetical protein MJY52_02215 [Bacteroidaceae bacterium]|nr:hypothetical protein [Bacteroidaceae bacterium]
MKNYYLKSALLLFVCACCLTINAQTFRPTHLFNKMQKISNVSATGKSIRHEAKTADGDYSDWTKWKDGTCTYESVNEGIQKDLKIYYRESKTKPATDAQFKIEGFGQNKVNLIINYNPTTDSCTVDCQHIGMFQSYEYSVCDMVNWYREFFPEEYQPTYKDAPCTYSKEYGCFRLNLAYIVTSEGEARGLSLEYGVDVCCVDGAEKKPYTEWAPFGNGTGSYEYKNPFMARAFTPSQNEIKYRTNNVTGLYEFEVAKWADLTSVDFGTVTLKFTMNPQNNDCVITRLLTKFSDDANYSIYMSDVAEYMGGDPTYYVIWPCKYLPEYGLFDFNVVYTSYNPDLPDDKQVVRVFNETFQVDGDYKKVWTDWADAGIGSYTWKNIFAVNMQTGAHYQMRTNICKPGKNQVKIIDWGKSVLSDEGTEIIIDYNTNKEDMEYGTCYMKEQPANILTDVGMVAVQSFLNGNYDMSQHVFYLNSMRYRFLNGLYAGSWIDGNRNEIFRAYGAPTVWSAWEELGKATYKYTNPLVDGPVTADNLTAYARISTVDPDRTQIMIKPCWTDAFGVPEESDSVLYLEYNNKTNEVNYIVETSLGLDLSSGRAMVCDAYNYKLNFTEETPTADDLGTFDPQTQTFSLKMMYYQYEAATDKRYTEDLGKFEETLVLSSLPSGIEGIKSTLNSQRPTSIYNVAGQQVKTVTRGLYIMNGKKYLVR